MGAAGGRYTQTSRRRVQLVAVCALALFAFLALRATWLGAVRGPSLSAKADQQHLITLNVPARRGNIMSADGRPLAIDKPSVLITADARFVNDPEAVADKLVSAIGGSPKDLNRITRDLRSRKPYVVIKRHASIKEERYLQSLGLPGIHFTRTTARLYPKGKVAGQVLGFTGVDGKGLEGLERRLDRQLAGTPGTRVEVRDPELGQTVRIQSVAKPVPGSSVTLSIHAGVNQKMDEVLLATRNKYGAKSATGVIMDPHSGEIVAMGTVPRIDPNRLDKLIPERVANRAVIDPYEPGSVFKLVTVAGVIEDGEVSPTTTFNLPPTYVVPGEKGTKDFIVREAHERTTHETFTTTEILQESSNVGVLWLSRYLERKNRLRYWMDRFGFGHRTGVDIAAEDPGRLPAFPWNTGQRWNIPLGQGMTATQLQQVRAFAAVANGGYLVTPHVVTRIGGQAVAPTKRTRILKEDTTHALTSMLQRVVEGTDGTAPDAKLENYTVAGKTGTAEKVNPKTGKYYTDRYRASFIGFVPANKPRLVISVMVDEPDFDGPHTGGAVAAPAFRDIADYALEALDIPPQ
jgi:cell division protein FtsI/penicillin-binding protein 2